jgi:hypothetical protein
MSVIQSSVTFVLLITFSVNFQRQIYSKSVEWALCKFETREHRDTVFPLLVNFMQRTRITYEVSLPVTMLGMKDDSFYLRTSGYWQGISDDCILY